MRLFSTGLKASALLMLFAGLLAVVVAATVNPNGNVSPVEFRKEVLEKLDQIERTLGNEARSTRIHVYGRR